MKVRILHGVNAQTEGCKSCCKSYSQLPYRGLSFSFFFLKHYSHERFLRTQQHICDRAVPTQCLYCCSPFPAGDFCGCTDCLLMNNIINYLQKKCIKSHALFALIGVTVNSSKTAISLDIQKEAAVKQSRGIKEWENSTVSK